MASATPSSDARYDVWMVEARDPGGAIDVLTGVLGDRQRAREAVLSTPAMLLHGVSAAEVETLRGQLAPHGVGLEARPSRRAAAVTPATPATPATHATHATHATPATPATPAPTAAPVSAGSDAPAQLGVAKVAYHAALVAAPAYVLQPMVLLAIFALTLLTLASSFGALTGSFTIALLAPMAVSGLRFSVFSLIVRRSRAGQTDLRLDDSEQDLFGLLFAGVRFVFVTLSAFGPFFLVSWATGPKLITYAMMGEAGLGTGELVLTLLLLAVTVIVPLISLPGAYAATALGTGCNGVNPLVGLVVLRRIPGPYFLTLAYLTAFWFASAALTSGGALAAFSSVADGSEDMVAGALLSMVLFTGVMTLLDVTSMLISARVLGLMTYHYREELGL